MCGYDGEWSRTTPKCVLVDCGFPEDAEHGSVSVNTTTYGQLASYSCDNGFYTTDNTIVECVGNGSWSSQAPVCRPVDCSMPNVPTNARVITVSCTTYDKTITFECSPGYYMVGSNISTCMETGNWDGLPFCRRINCGLPLTPDNGRTYFYNTVFGSIVIYQCDAGHVLDGNRSSMCEIDGNWSNAPPICIAVNCGSPAEPANGSVSYTSTDFGSTATYVCDTGFIQDNFDSRTCLQNGTWSFPVPHCRVNLCENITVPPTSVISASGTQVGDVATYSCVPGFMISNNITSRICQPDGSWSLPEPVCSFDTSIAISNGISSTTDQQTVQFSNEYSVFTETLISSSTTEPSINCGSPEEPENGFLSLFNGTNVGSLVYFSCNIGFYLRGNAAIVCLESGTQHPPNACCKIVKRRQIPCTAL